MLGKMRAPSASPDSLERSTTKLLKHDSLSIYEATLLKLKQGSQQVRGSLTSEFVQPHDYSTGSSNCGDAITMECDCSCPNPPHSHQTLSHEKNPITVSDACILSSTTSNAHVMVNSKQRSNSDVSILHLFSKYKSSQFSSSSNSKTVITETNCLSMVPPSSGDYQSPSNMEQKCVGS